VTALLSDTESTDVRFLSAPPTLPTEFAFISNAPSAGNFFACATKSAVLVKGKWSSFVGASDECSATQAQVHGLATLQGALVVSGAVELNVRSSPGTTLSQTYRVRSGTVSGFDQPIKSATGQLCALAPEVASCAAASASSISYANVGWLKITSGEGG
jgi:hypothetical protein